MRILELLREGRTKRVYATDDPGIVLLDYKDEATAFKGLKHGRVPGKGEANNRISNCLMQMLERNGITTHYVEEISDTQTLVRRAEVIPLAVAVRNRAAGSLCQRLELAEGTLIPHPIVEYAYKNDELEDPLVNESHILTMGWASAEELREMTARARQINRLMQAYLKDKAVELVDMRLEFGRTRDGELILVDEISPDTCRFWDLNTQQKMDKDRFRENLGGVPEAYHEMMIRLLGL